MAKVIKFEGKTYRFPDDATDAEIAEALNSASKAGPSAPGMSELPGALKPNTMGPWFMGGALGEEELPCSASALEVLPGAGAAGGAMLAGPPGAAVGGGGGEIVRQVIRKMLGLAPATGNIQKWTGMDPEGLPASVTGAVAESATAGAGEALINRLAASGLPAYLREKALNMFGGMSPAKGEAAKAKMIEMIRPIAEERPVGSRTGIQRAAAKQAEKSGKAVGDIYNVDVPASFQPVVDRLKDLSGKQVRRAAHEVEAGIDPLTGKSIMETVPADIKNPKLQKALEKRAESMALAERAGRTSGQPTTIQDLFEARKAADEMAQAAKSFVPDKASKELTPAVRALKSERTAITEQLHDPNVWAGAEAGKTDDAIHAAWKTVESGTKGQATGSFVERWVLARFPPGLYGTAAGAVAAKPAFWRSVGAKALREAATAIQNGDDAVAFRIMNAAINDYQGATIDSQHRRILLTTSLPAEKTLQPFSMVSLAKTSLIPDALSRP